MTPLRRQYAGLRRATGHGGFTVVEMLVTFVILGVVFSLFALVLSSTLRNSTEVREDAVLQGEVRASIDMLAQDLRQAYTGDSTSPIEKMTATELTFWSPDRATPFHNRRISYRLLNGDLQRAQAVSTNTNGPTWTFPSLGPYSRTVGSVRNTTIFTYYDDLGAVTSTATDVASVTVTVTVSTKGSKSRLFTYSTSVALRAGE